jgi:hypothetical protein
MEEISGIAIDALKKLGFSDADLGYILEVAEKYRQRWRGHVAAQNLPDERRQEIVQIATNSFQTGMLLGFGKARKIPNAANKIGFAP